MRRLLMISYDFPPSSVGIWRTLKFCRYMPEFGWQPHILTVLPVRSPRFDLGPLRELPPDVEIRRTESIDPNRAAFLWAQWRQRRKRDAEDAPPPKLSPTNAKARAVNRLLRAWVFMPDDRMGWIPFALHEGRRWLRQQRFDAVYSTCFPHTAHVVGERLAAWSGLPYIADFRDIWIRNYLLYNPATRLHDAFQRGLEARVIRRANRVLSATNPITHDFLARYPRESPGKFLTLTNGFDEGDFARHQLGPDPDHFVLTYAGTMFGSTSPRSFFKAVKLLLRREPQWRPFLRLRFVGSMIEPYRVMLERAGLAGISTIEGYMAHGDAVRIMAQAQALLLIVARQPGSHIMLTQKVFEYAAARRPILGLVPEGAARDFLTDLGEGPVVPPDDPQAIARALRGMLLDWKENGRRLLPPNPWLDQFSRRALTQRFCDILDDAIAAPR